MQPGKLYRPSNGTEGDCFYSAFCEHCERDAQYSDYTPELGCKILADTYAYDIGDKNYPKEWIYGKDGRPICTAFVEAGKDIPYRCDKTLDMFNH